MRGRKKGREREKGTMLGVLMEFVVLLIPPSTVSVVIDAYTHNSTLSSGDSVPFGIQLILVCQVVGLPYGIQLRFTSGQTSTTHLPGTVQPEYAL